MSIESKITYLLKNGVANVAFGTSPTGDPYVVASVNVPTGGEGCMLQTTHQKVASTIEGCLDAVTKDIEHVSELQKARKLSVVPEAN